MNEFRLIDTFVRAFRPAPAPAGPGDDAAVLRVHGNLVATTDTATDGVHFTRDTFTLPDVGYKALAVNLSDLAAMGATPTYFLCALGLPHGFSPHEVRALARGMAALARHHHVELAGGNVSYAPKLSVTITALGLASHPLLRSGARAGEDIVLSHPLGDAAAFLCGSRHPAACRAQRRPTPQLAWVKRARPYLTAAIDVSDGLIADLGHLCFASRVAADLDVARIPLGPSLAAAPPERALDLALAGGEDYALVATVGRGKFARLSRALARGGMRAYRIGATAAPGRRNAILLDDAPWKGPGGFRHFQDG